MTDPTALDRQAAVEYGTFIDVAYEMFERPVGNVLLPQQPPDFPKGYHLIAWIDMSDFAVFGESIVKFYGFVARNDSDPYQDVIVVRGTEGLVEWWDDAIFWPIVFAPAPSAGLVHCGFYRIYRTMRVIGRTAPAMARMTAATFADQIEQLLATVPPERRHFDAHGVERKHELVVTGHSLGAALCTLYVMEHAIRKRADPSRQVVINRLCTFASPRVGTADFVAQFDALPIDSWRIANLQDLVPRVPPPWLCGYQHVATAYEFTSAEMVRFSPSCWHSMRTYLHWLDPQTQPIDPTCSRERML